MRKRPKKLPTILTEDERKALLKVPNKRYPTALRNYCIMITILDTGMRAQDICNLKLVDIDLNTGHIKIVEGKGKVDRYLWINGNSLEWLRKWIVIKPVSEYVFCTLKGDKLDSSYLRHCFARYGKKAKIEKRIHPHQLRHTFAVDYYRVTKDLVSLQKILGHASLQTTQVYTYVYDEDVKNGMKEFRNKKKKEQEVIEKIKKLEDNISKQEEELKKLKNDIDTDSLFHC